MSKELLVIEKLVPADVFKEGGIQPILDRIKEEASCEVPDLTTAKGRARIASNAYDIAITKGLLEKMGKALSDKLRAEIAPIMKERNLSEAFLDDLRDEIRKPLTDWEAAEEKRTADLDDRIVAIVDHSTACHPASESLLNSRELKVRLTALQGLVIDDSYGVRELEAVKAKASSVALIESHIVKAEKREAEKAELEELRIKAEKQKQKDHDDLIAKQAADKAKKEAEDLAKAEADRVEKERLAKEKEAERLVKEKEDERLAGLERERVAKEKLATAERDKIAAEERAKIETERLEKKAIDDAKQAEIDKAKAIEDARLAEIQRQKDEQKAIADAAEKREANKTHKKKINNQTVKCLMAVDPAITKEVAQKIVTALAKDEIDNADITY